MATCHILFRFHKSIDVCEQNVRVLRALNPGVPIYGLYGGADAQSLDKAVKEMFDSFFSLPFEDPRYNWMHGDLCIRWWFKQHGRQFDFSHLCVVEWDLMLLKPLADIYDGFKSEVNYVSLSPADYRQLLEEGWPWIQGNFQPQVDALMKKVAEEKPVDISTLRFGIFGGVVLCRSFLEQLAQRDVPSYSNDEVRLSVYSALFGIPLVDNGFLSDKRNKVDGGEGNPPDELVLNQVLAAGGCAVHPIRSVVSGIEQKLKGFSNDFRHSREGEYPRGLSPQRPGVE